MERLKTYNIEKIIKSNNYDQRFHDIIFESSGNYVFRKHYLICTIIQKTMALFKDILILWFFVDSLGKIVDAIKSRIKYGRQYAVNIDAFVDKIKSELLK